jgi:hypothetical protein
MWHYKQYQDEQSPQDRELYADADATRRRASRVVEWRESSVAEGLPARHEFATQARRLRLPRCGRSG